VKDPPNVTELHRGGVRRGSAGESLLLQVALVETPAAYGNQESSPEALSAKLCPLLSVPFSDSVVNVSWRSVRPPRRKAVQDHDPHDLRWKR
jgi:hypothetical protein